jgi:hypothetical protein
MPRHNVSAQQPDTSILWLTIGTIKWLNTIGEAWIGHAFLPAFFATQSDLDADTPQWCPWEPLRLCCSLWVFSFERAYVKETCCNLMTQLA